MATPIHPPPRSHSKSLEIESMRGLACLLLVAYHVIGHSSSSGMRLPEGSDWHFFINLVAYIRMPVFAFISGYVYALYVIPKTDYPKFYMNKIRRLGMPLLSASFLFFLISHMLNTEYAVPWNKIYEIYLWGYAHYWYLQASLIVFLVISILEFLGLIHSKKRIIILFIISLGIAHVTYSLDLKFFSLKGAIYLFPFFILGLYLKRYEVIFTKTQAMIFSIICALGFVLIALQLKNMFVIFDSVEKEGLIFILFSCLCCVTFVAYGFKLNWLAYIGTYTYAIYLYHFAQSGARIFLFKAVPDLPHIIVFSFCMLAGVIVPIIMEKIFKRNKYLNFIFLGDRLNKKKSSNNA